ncbi:MAG TPA: class I SAM-dependent methyltransferase [Bryobacteraceae bacterium]|nr:class I SAM-dependent methyltransferase [Bryobacteraceae bacterium]
MTGAERSYYDLRAAEYDDFYLGTGLYASRVRPGWAEELTALKAVLAGLDFSSLLDVACGTGFLTQCFRGGIVGLDQSASMLEVARARVPSASFIRGDARRLPFRAKQFDCVAAGHFYGHLDEPAARAFLNEATRVAHSILIVDAAKRDEVPEEEHQHRVLNDGSRHVVYKRFFAPDRLIAELGAGRILHAGRWFVALLAQ